MQLVLGIGCKVIATAGSEEKRRICVERAGVDAAVDYGKKDWQVREEETSTKRSTDRDPV